MDRISCFNNIIKVNLQDTGLILRPNPLVSKSLQLIEIENCNQVECQATVEIDHTPFQTCIMILSHKTTSHTEVLVLCQKHLKLINMEPPIQA